MFTCTVVELETPTFKFKICGVPEIVAEEQEQPVIEES